MTDDEKKPNSEDRPSEAPLNETTAPIEHLEKGGDKQVPLDRTISEMKDFMGSEAPPDSGRRQSRKR